MHTHSKVALLAAALLAVSSTFALAADKKVAFVFRRSSGFLISTRWTRAARKRPAKLGVDFIYQGAGRHQSG